MRRNEYTRQVRWDYKYGIGERNRVQKEARRKYTAQTETVRRRGAQAEAIGRYRIQTETAGRYGI